MDPELRSIQSGCFLWTGFPSREGRMTQSFPLYGYLAGILAQGHAVERLNHLLGEMATSAVGAAETELLAMCLL